VSVTRNEAPHGTVLSIEEYVGTILVRGTHWVESGAEPEVRISRTFADSVGVHGLTNIRALAAHLTAFCDAVEKETA
jgi:hypothetical protein